MQFYDLLADASGQPTIQATENSVIIALPTGLAETAGIKGGGFVRLQYGEAGERKAVRLSASTETTEWKAVARKNVVQVYARQLLPAGAVEKTVVSHASDGRALVLDLPDGWALAEPGVVHKPAVRAARR